MNITYLKNLENNLTIDDSEALGMSLEDIDKAENTLNIKFPKAYKEFMYLAGEYTGGLRLFGSSSFSWVARQESLDSLKSQLAAYSVLQDRPIWVFSEYDDFEQFLFFYLDDKKDDPIIWQAILTDVTEISGGDSTFSSFVNGSVERSIEITNGKLDYEP